MDRMRKDRQNPEHPGGESALPGWKTVLGGTVVLLLLVILAYVGYQILHLVNPPNTYETVLTATVEDKVEADGVLLFEETVIPGSGDLGYLVEDGARVSAGTVVAEVYTNSGQSALRAALDGLNEQIELLRRAENVSSTQVDTMIQERTTALYDLLDAADRGAPAAMDEGREAYLLAQNKILVVTGEASDFASQIAALQAEAAQLQSQLGAPAAVTAPLTGYFVRSASTRQLTQPAEAILAPAQCPGHRTGRRPDQLRRQDGLGVQLALLRRLHGRRGPQAAAGRRDSADQYHSYPLSRPDRRGPAGQAG